MRLKFCQSGYVWRHSAFQCHYYKVIYNGGVIKNDKFDIVI